MIKNFEFYHGLVFVKILHARQEVVSIRAFSQDDNCSYVINERIGIYIKYSGKRLSPWNFSFLKAHQEKIEQMQKKLGTIYLLLVCDDDGVVVLSFEELKQILDNVHDSIEWVSVSRGKGEMYAVKGSDGALNFKIGKHDFPNKIFQKSPPGGFFKEFFGLH